MLGNLANADAAAVRREMAGLAQIYHSDKGETPEQMAAINAAEAEAMGIIPRPSRPRPLSPVADTLP